MISSQTLILNAGFEPVQFVSWQKAICLVLADKATVVSEYQEKIRTVRQNYPLPSVVRLNRYVRVVHNYSIARCSRKNVLMRDRYQCQYCGKKAGVQDLTIDHVIPRSRGGKTTWKNVVTACGKCNREKGNQWVKDFKHPLMRRPKRPNVFDMLTQGKRLQPEWHDFFSYLTFQSASESEVGSGEKYSNKE